MKLAVSKRSLAASQAKKIRRNGNIPAVVYSQGKVGAHIEVQGAEFRKILNEIEPGTLSTTVFQLEDGGKKHSAILKDIQYHVTTYEPLHLDFQELVDKVPVTVNVPLVCTGVADCVGIKLGGFLRQIYRVIRVKCLPKDIPSQFEIDVRDLNVGQSRVLSEVAFPKGVTPLMELKNIAVTIAKK